MTLDESSNWHHFTVTADSETLNLYQNGERVDVDLISSSGK